MKTFSVKITVAIDSSESSKKIRVLKKPYEHLMKKVNIIDLKVTDTELICKYRSHGVIGEMHLYDLSSQINK